MTEHKTHRIVLLIRQSKQLYQQHRQRPGKQDLQNQHVIRHIIEKKCTPVNRASGYRNRYAKIASGAHEHANPFMGHIRKRRMV